MNKAKWINLIHLNLGIYKSDKGHNNIGPEGCMHLSSSNWKNLTHLYLGNKINHKGCNYIKIMGANI